jgi:rod shape determining protein RodA
LTRRLWRNVDWLLIAVVLALVAAGLVAVYSATHIPANPARSALFQKQLTWLFIGSAVLFLTAAIPFRVWEEYSPVLFGLALLLLVTVLAVGVERGGARRWLAIGGFQIQPSEMAKLALLLFAARLLSRPRLDVRRLGHLMPVLAASGAVFLFILIEPDLGTSLSIPASLTAMLYWAGLSLGTLLVVASPLVGMILSFNLWLWLLFFGALGVALAQTGARRTVVVGVLALNMAVGAATPILWNSLRPYQRDRVVTLLNPEKDRVGAGYQVNQSKIAIGSGGIGGRGLLKGTQKGLAFLPEPHTDFIFSVLGEEFGFVGCSILLLLFALLIQRGIMLAVKARSRFASLLVIGICAVIFFHVAVNVGMTLGLAPVTGLPLPFISYGGTFLLATMAQMGFLINVAIRRNEF